MRPMFIVMGRESKTVTKNSNSGPDRVLIVRHQFMRKREELELPNLSLHLRAWIEQQAKTTKDCSRPRAQPAGPASNHA